MSASIIRDYLNAIRPMTKGESDLVNVCLMMLAEIERLDKLMGDPNESFGMSVKDLVVAYDAAMSVPVVPVTVRASQFDEMGRNGGCIETDNHR